MPSIVKFSFALLFNENKNVKVKVTIESINKQYFIPPLSLTPFSLMDNFLAKELIFFLK